MRTSRALIFILTVAVWWGAVPPDWQGGIRVGRAAAQTDLRRVPETRQQINWSFAPLVKRAAPAVVNIYTRRVVRERGSSLLFNDPFFRRFFGDLAPSAPGRERIQNALGSGVIVDPDGLIVTNAHVIEGSDEITVVLHDRREFEATVVRSDAHSDLAVLRVDAGGQALPTVPMGNSDDLEVGDLVLAIGNPFGVGQTVTSGIVSAVARTNLSINDYGFFIQTDAAINPGNSGGALVDMNGRLVGVNTAIFSRSGGSLGIGFAIPANLVRTVVASVGSSGPLVRPWLGAEGQSVTQDLASAMGLSRPRGVLISRLRPRSPLGRAGARVGDIVLAVDSRPVDDPIALRFRISTRTIGSRADVDIWRDGREYRLQVPIERPPEDPPRNQTAIGGENPLSGATVANLSPAVTEELSLDAGDRGVVVIDVAPRSVARRLGFRPGDVVLEINGREIGSVSALQTLLGRRTRAWDVSIRRDGRVLSLSVG